MLIQCTKKLMDELKIKPVLMEGEKSLFGGHLNLASNYLVQIDSNNYIRPNDVQMLEVKNIRLSQYIPKLLRR